MARSYKIRQAREQLELSLEILEKTIGEMHRALQAAERAHARAMSALTNIMNAESEEE
ncbi:MAG TPA: hypothetical protein VMI75_03970 [Polyangiaceae bacterium]|nr:hypothetical protein [Polyangiaceae bacterium]